MARFMQADARKVIRWYQQQMKMQDWTFKVWIQDAPPEWTEERAVEGRTIYWPQTKTANIWVAPAKNGNSRREIVMTLFHELLHVQAQDVGIRRQSKAIEWLWDGLAMQLEKAYRTNRR